MATNDEEQAQIARSVREYKIPFPVYADRKLAVANAVEADFTPEAFLLDSTFVLRYRGRINDEYSARLKKKAAASERK